VQGTGFRVQGLRFRVQGKGMKGSPEEKLLAFIRRIVIFFSKIRIQKRLSYGIAAKERHGIGAVGQAVEIA
jgi:hypothetical protein